MLVTTHFLEEAEHCHNLGFMVAGRIVADGSPNEIKQAQPGQLMEVRTSNNQKALELLRRLVTPWKVSLFGDSLHLVVDNGAEFEALRQRMEGAGLRVAEQRTIPFSLEDAFIGIVERHEADEAVA